MRFLPVAWFVAACLSGCSAPVPPTRSAEAPVEVPETGDRAARIESITQELTRLFQTNERAESQVPAFQERMMAVAGERVDDASGREALLWVVCHGQFSPAAADLAGQAADLLIAHHLTHPDMRLACDRLPNLADKAEGRLRTIRAGTPDDVTRGAALLALADILIARGHVTARTSDREKLYQEAVDCLEEVEQKYADLRLWERSNRYGVRAGQLLDQVRHLAVGCPAPPVEGETLTGKELRLSDYRGGVS